MDEKILVAILSKGSYIQQVTILVKSERKIMEHLPDTRYDLCSISSSVVSIMIWIPYLYNSRRFSIRKQSIYLWRVPKGYRGAAESSRAGPNQSCSRKPEWISSRGSRLLKPNHFLSLSLNLSLSHIWICDRSGWRTCHGSDWTPESWNRWVWRICYLSFGSSESWNWGVKLLESIFLIDGSLLFQSTDLLWYNMFFRWLM